MGLVTADPRDRLLVNRPQPDADSDTLLGLADPGFGSPEFGSFSLSDLASTRLPLGMGIERDILFKATFPPSVHAEAARRAGNIVESAWLLHAAALALREYR